MPEFQTQTLTIHGVQTDVKSTGSGPPLLFLHGAATIEGFDFAEGLAHRFRVVIPSHPGMGFSGPAPGMVGAGDLVLHYLDLLAALGLQNPHLMGFSMGGWIATELAAVAPGSFDRLVLVAPAGLNDPAHPATPLDSIAPQDFPAHLSHDPAVAARYFPTDAASAAAFGADRAREGAAVAGFCTPFGMGHPNLRRRLARIRNPTLVVWGEEDRLLPASQAPLWAAALPQARVLMVPGAGHLVLQEAPACLSAIADFLS